jgi:cytidylate kinase
LKADYYGMTNPSEIAVIAENLNLRVDGEIIFLDGKDVTKVIRSDLGGAAAKRVAKFPEVRQALLDFQLGRREAPGLVADGRDQCFIFDTPHRFFLETDPKECASRRMTEFENRGIAACRETVLSEIIQRNHEDRTRAVSPLCPHPQAIVIDTTLLTRAQVAEMIISAYRNRIAAVA